MRLLCTTAFAVTAGLFAASTVAAAPPKVDPAAAPFVMQLHQVVQVLNEANHDYDGHRAKAVHFVHEAIHALHPHHKKPMPGTTVKPTTPPAPPTKEDQRISDVQLTKAMQMLQAVQKQLANSTAPNAVKAVAEIQAALAELKTALAIK